jgi:hypothetical protein
MPSAATSKNYPTPTPWVETQALGERKKAVSAQQAKAITIPTRRGFGRVTIGIFLGGLLLGTAGCILGAVMPHRHPVGMTISVLWWGLYFGCFGASVGALVGILTDRAPPRARARGERAGKVAEELGPDSRTAHAGSSAVRPALGPLGLPGHQRERERPA